MLNIYIASGSRAPRRIHRDNYYILEFKTNKGDVTAGGFWSGDETMHGASVETLKAAAARLKLPYDVTVYTDDQYIAGIINELESLRASGFRKASGEMIAHAEAWETIAGKLKTAAATTERHSYLEWMYSEIKRGRKHDH